MTLRSAAALACLVVLLIAAAYFLLPDRIPPAMPMTDVMQTPVAVPVAEISEPLNNPDDEQARAARVFGHVEDASGDPIPKVLVQFVVPVFGEAPAETLYECNEYGEFDFGHEFGREGHFWLAVVGPTFESGQSRYDVAALDANGPIVLVAFPNTGSIAGQLVDGKKVIQLHRQLLATSKAKTAITKTSEAGAFHFEGLLPGTYSFYALKDSADVPDAVFTNENAIRAAPELTITAGQQLAGVTLEIGRGGRIWGHVTDNAGEAIEGVTLMAWPDGDPTTIATAKTDTSGNYELTGIPENTSRIAEINVMRSEFESIQTRVSIDVPYNVSLTRLASLRGRVVDAQSGEPVTTFRVAAWTTDMPVADEKQAVDRLGPKTFTADDGGRFELTARNGAVTVGVSAEGYAIGLVRVDTPALNEVVVRLTPAETKVLTGSVVSPQGSPIPGAGVFFETAMDSPEAVTDADGRFTIANRPSHVRALVAFKEGYGRGIARLSSAPTQDPVVIRLTVAASVRGTVTIDGRAAEDAFSSAALFLAETQAPTRHVYNRALEQGKFFELRGVSAGNYFLEVGIDEGARVIRRRLRVLEGSATTTHVDFDVPRDTLLKGLVALDEKPLAECRIVLRYSLGNDDLLVLFARTDDGGRYLISNVPPGDCEVEVLADDIQIRGGRFVAKVVVAQSGLTTHDIHLDSANY